MQMNIQELPDDILSLIFVLLTPKDFLSLCRSSKLLYTGYQKNPLFWRTKVSTIFRTPISPLLKADGARWYSLFHRLRTQTRLYTWGQGLKGNLGQGVSVNRLPPRNRGRIAGRVIPAAPRLRFQRTTSTWPTEAHVPDEVGAIADLQCGGWSTIILSSTGKLYAIGSINSANFFNVGISTDQFERLTYLTQSTSAISQFSAGRSHVLALTDDHEILSWDRIDVNGLKVLSRSHTRFSGRPISVVAGWAESSVYIPEVGIVYWTPLKNDQEDDMLDARAVQEKVIPNTARKIVDDQTVQVTAHILLEGLVVWITSNSQVWVCDIASDNVEDTEPKYPAFRLPGFTDDGDELSDLQGSFRNFAVFTSSGRVLAGNAEYIRKCYAVFRNESAKNINMGIGSSDPATWDDLPNIISWRPKDVPALQHTGVISVRFGDYHYHALHSNGRITSHGHEPESCGALGLGDVSQGGRFRGLYSTEPRGFRQDSNLRPVADLRGRQVWFEPAKLEWLKHLQKSAEEELAQHPEEAYWTEILHDEAKQTMFSEWIEQEGRHWEDDKTIGDGEIQKSIRNTDQSFARDSHLDAYFTLAIGAAGWHSGALVLVDEEKTERVYEKWSGGTEPVWISQDFPRIEFPDGTESPQVDGLGQGEHTLAGALRPWQDGMPSMRELGLGGRSED